MSRPRGSKNTRSQLKVTLAPGFNYQATSAMQGVTVINIARLDATKPSNNDTNNDVRSALREARAKINELIDNL